MRQSIPISLFSSFSAQAQSLKKAATKEITVEDIWQNYSFYPNSVPGFNFQKDGKHYTLLDKNQIKQYDLTTGDFTKILFSAEDASAKELDGAFDSYAFSADEKKMLIQTKTDAIYRHSTKAEFFVWDGKKLEMLRFGLSKIKKNLKKKILKKVSNKF